jgi:hypothetical protein
VTNIVYHAPPTVARFMKSEAFFRLIAGPVGSGKTTGCLFEIFRRACEQEKAPDGYRYTRFAIVRQTLKQLKDTVLKDITTWLSGIAEWKVSENTIFIRIGDVRSEWILIPLDNPEDQARLLSMQITGAWMSEAIEMDVQLIAPLAGRCGRYPSAAQGGATWFGIIADTNMPSEGSDWHKLMDVETPPDWQVFIQPGGMEDNAENLEWLTQTPQTLKLAVDDPARRKQGRSYYERFLRNNNADWCTRYVHAKYGNDPSGSAVFKESFKLSYHAPVDENHKSIELTPVHHMPLIIGQDFGRNPCAVVTQLDHKGRLLILEEIISEDMGLELHINRNLRPILMQERYSGIPVVVVGDPAGTSRSSLYEETEFDLLKRAGLKAFPAPSNDPSTRLRAVEAFLLQQRDGGPAFIMDREKCPVLTRAMSGGYRFAKMRSGQLKPLPDKNEFSHVSDALQYACLAAHGGQVTQFATALHRVTYKPPPVNTSGWT